MNLSKLEKAKRQISRIPYRITDNQCHIPINRKPNLHGYINTNFEFKQTKLHRLVAFVYLGLDIDNELELALHKNECHNRACFNQEHLYTGNHSQNTKDSVTIKTHHESRRLLCKRGHRYDMIRWKNGKIISRRCSECRKITG